MPMAWSIEAVMKNRRKRKARRVWKQQPLFAFSLLAAEFPDYTPEAFIKDVRITNDKKSKFKKTSLARYGRYPVLMNLLAKWKRDRDVSIGLEILKLRRNMTKPYRLVVTFEKKQWCFEYPATYAVTTMEKLVTAADSAKNLEEFKEKEKNITRYLGFGQ